MTLLAASLFDATVLLAAGLAALALLRRRSAALRHAILAATIGAAIVAPAFELLIPPLPVVSWDASPAPVAPGVTTGVQAMTATTGTMAEAPPSRFTVPWTTWLLVAWALGAGVTLAGLVVGLVRLGNVTRRCVPVHAGPWRRITDELSLASGLRRTVAILQSGDPALLVTCGVLQPKIILPSGAGLWSDDRVRVVLAHEMAHIRRRDGAVQLAGEVLRIAHWFNPLVWLSCRCLRQESEYACDDAVLSGGVDATECTRRICSRSPHMLRAGTTRGRRRRPSPIRQPWKGESPPCSRLITLAGLSRAGPGLLRQSSSPPCSFRWPPLALRQPPDHQR